MSIHVVEVTWFSDDIFTCRVTNSTLTPPLPHNGSMMLLPLPVQGTSSCWVPALPL